MVGSGPVLPTAGGPAPALPLGPLGSGPHPAPAGQDERTLGLGLVFLAALAWSTGGVLLRAVETDPWSTIFWRSLCAAATLALFVAIRDRRDALRLFLTMGWPGLGMALCSATASSTFVLALQHTTVANVMLLQALAPFLAALLAWVFLRERVAPRTWIAMTVAFAGVGVMVSDSLGRGTLGGDLLGGIVALAFAASTVILRYNRHVRMAPAACLATLIAAGFALSQGASLGIAPRDLGLLAALGVGQLGLGMILYTSGARLVPAAEAALVSNIEVILGPLWVWLAFAENPGLPTIVGGCIILAAIVGHGLGDLRRGIGRRIAPPSG
ncbi:MAG: DMT family transporter [Ectothiorhodospiraceae bacterium]|nr:DMT family transporter [Ectothiorhodospiraceae bacterium]